MSSSMISELFERYPDIAFRLQFETFEKRSPVEEEAVQIPQPLDEIEVFYVYGIGSGAHYTALQEWLTGMRERQLIFLEDDLSALNAFFETPLAQEMVCHSQVHIYFFSSLKEMVPLIKEIATTFPSEYIACSSTKAYAKKKRARLQKMQLALHRTATVNCALMAEALYGHKLLPNILKNVLQWPASFSVVGLKDAFKAVPAIICGAGPSLSKHFELLKTVGDRALIFAGGSTIAALSNHGIIPHIGMALDPNKEEFDRLKAASSFEMPLLYGTRLEPSVFHTQNGPRGYLISETGGACEAHFEKCFGLTDPAIGPELGVEALSVTTLCVALAVEMGCDPIIFTGLDLSYPGMQRYAPGIMASSTVSLKEISHVKRSSDRLVRRRDIFGKPTHTLIKWIMESECLSAYAQKHPTHRFINATAGGLGFPKIPSQSFEEILSTLHKSQDLSAALHLLIQSHTIHCTQPALLEEMRTLYESLERMHTFSIQMLQELTRAQSYPTGQTTLLEYDFQEEKAFDVLFLPLNDALESLLNRRYYPSPLLTEEQKKSLQFQRQVAKWTDWQQRILFDKEILLKFITKALCEIP